MYGSYFQSSLLNLLSGELHLMAGTMNVDGNISYTPQQPWVFSDSLRENVLFGCEYREGRAQSAPLLRPMGDDGRQGGHAAVDPLPAFSADCEYEAGIHDEPRLPNMHSEDEIRRLFPTIDAAPAKDNTDHWNPEEEANDPAARRGICKHKSPVVCGPPLQERRPLQKRRSADLVNK